MAARLSSAEVSFILHATEDEERSLQTVAEKLSIPLRLFSSSHMTGHFNNPLTYCTASMHGELANRFAEALFSKIRESDRSHLKSNLSKYMDEHGGIYLRLDKQKIFKDRFELSQGDCVRIKLKPLARWRKSAYTAVEDLLQ